MARSAGADSLIRYLSYEQVLKADAGRTSFVAWVKMRVRTSFAYQGIPFAMREELTALRHPPAAPRFAEMARRQPALARAVIRALRERGSDDEATDRLARYRLLEMLELPSLKWKEWPGTDAQTTF